MLFGHKTKKAKSRLPSLTEGDIRSRLYGSAVGIAVDTRLKDEPASRKGKKTAGRPAPTNGEPDGERAKIQRELKELRTELEQTKRKLKRMRGVRAKKMRLIVVSLIVLLAAAVLIIAAAKRFFFAQRAVAPTVVDSPVAKYAIQAAVYGNVSDAQRFSQELVSKGYKSFVKEAYFESGKRKFKVYVGAFKDKESASKVLNRIKSEEGIKDSFIASIEKED